MQKHIRKRTLRIVVMSLTLAVLVFAIGSVIAIYILYDQQFPRFDKPEFTAYLTYKDVDGYEPTVVKFESGRNVLTGYIYGEKNDKGLVVVVHGLGGGAVSYLAETMYFVDNGWRVFSFDCTGSYESEGEGTVGISQSLMDLDAALKYIETNSELNDLPIMLYGHSWGGYAVAAVLNCDYDITAVASIAGFNSPMEVLIEQAERIIGRFAYIAYPFEWLCQTMLFGRRAHVTAVNGINATDAAVMIVHGDQDEAISYNGASIIAHRNEITNPNVVYKTCSAENHNGHNNLYLSSAASRYINVKNEEYRGLYHKYDGSIPHDVKAEFYEGINRGQTCELNISFMNNINYFFENCLDN